MSALLTALGARVYQGKLFVHLKEENPPGIGYETDIHFEGGKSSWHRL
jgi:hypothetical protein